MVAAERQIWIDWGRWMVSNYQRTSSAVEGQNGYLAGDLSIRSIDHLIEQTVESVHPAGIYGELQKCFETSSRSGQDT